MHYRRIDVRDTELLNSVIEAIGDTEGRLDGLIAAAGIQQETPALEYSAKDSNTMFDVNVTGVFMTSQAVAKQMIRFGNGGSIAMIASMSGTIANRVCATVNSYSSQPCRAHLPQRSARWSHEQSKTWCKSNGQCSFPPHSNHLTQLECIRSQPRFPRVLPAHQSNCLCLLES